MRHMRATRRGVAIALLALGTLVGYGSGIAHALHAHGHCHDACAGAVHRGDTSP
jgi:hypothetical protein